MEEQEEAGGGGADSQENRGGVRFITDELLLNLTGRRALAPVRSLSLSSSTAAQHFTVLELKHHLIQMIERLSALTHLRGLQLAHSSIRRIEGLLSNLHHLRLSYSRIEHISVYLGKELRSLHTLHLQDDLITSLYEAFTLHSLSSLSELSVPGISASSLLRSHLGTLDRLDDQPINELATGHAHRRFSGADADLLHTANQLEPEHLVSQRQQEGLSHHFSKRSVLEELRDEAEDARRQMDGQTEELQTQLLMMDATDPQQVHVTSEVSSCRQLLGRMSRMQRELEGRLDDLLSRIAMETQEIKELEQQLTNGQIMANEALQRDLEEVISGLQEYLRGLREQAHRSQQQVHSLQAENQSLQLHLEDTERHCRQLEDSVRTHTQNMSVQQGELLALRMEAQALKDRQVQSCREQVELEAELQQLREELSEQVMLGHDEKSCLQKEVHRLQAQLDQFTTALSEPQEGLRGAEEPDGDKSRYQTSSPISPDLTLSRSSDQLSGMIQQTGTCRPQRDIKYSQEHITRLQAELTRHQADHFEEQESGWKLEELQRSERRSRLLQQNLEAQLQESRLQLQDVRQERDELLQQLRSRSDAQQRSLSRINRKLRQLSRSTRDADQLTAEQLKSTTEQLRELNHTVELLQAQQEQESVDELDGDAHRDRDPPSLQEERTVEELKAELADAHRQTRRLKNKLDRVRTETRTGIKAGDGGRWWFVPAGLSAPSLGSQGTQDSGLGLQYLCSPERGQHQDGPPAGGSYWVYTLPAHTTSGWRDSSRGDTDGSSGGLTPPLPPDPAAGDSQTPPFGPAWLLYGSPAAVVYGPPAGGAAAHGDTGGGCVCECVHSEAEKKKKKKLLLENKELRDALRQHRTVMQLCEEVECVEKTLLKRRAELREADRKLLEAQSCIHTSREQASEAQRDSAVLQLSMEDSATRLLEATQHTRELQEEVEQLRRTREEEEQMLKQVEVMLRSREEELQQLDSEIQTARDTLADLLSDSQGAQRRLDSLSCQEEQQEQRLLQKKEEHETAVRRLEEVREEERRLHNTAKELLEQQGALLRGRKAAVSAVREEEERLVSLKAELSTHREELKQVLQELLAEQQTLEDVKTKRTQTLQQLHRTKEELHRQQEKLDKKQEQVEGVRDELDELQDKMDRKRVELAELKQDVESQRRQAEACLGEKSRQQAELQEVQEELSRGREERRSLREQCKHLEARRRHANRCLSVVQVELAKQKEEYNHTHLLQQEVMRETTASQHQLNKSSELLSLLSQQVEEKKKHLQTVEQELSVFSQQRAEQLKELNTQIQHKQTALDDVKAAVSEMEDRGRQLSEQQLQLDWLSGELRKREKRLHRKEEELEKQWEELQQRGEELKQKKDGLQLKEEELKQQTEGLQVKEEGLKEQAEELQHREEELQMKEEELCVKEEVLHKNQESSEVSSEEEESFYLSTTGLRSAFSTEEEKWRAELQREKLRQHEDRLKARLRCSLRSQQENLKVRRLETEETLRGLKTSVDRLDSLLTHTT
ncbi:centriolin-like [Archocentrus centrarchus]|uniref:centriolin-like n=1 Tax=Archocentrus centrarchus TaxID=63155 RepID=UPI0011E9CBE1|nr:centriolin-like [Archocentrus centrarchus]